LASCCMIDLLLDQVVALLELRHMKHIVHI
jgi:hypothetical protein